MFYEVREGFTVSLDRVRIVRIICLDDCVIHALELVYDDSKTRLSIEESESRDDLLPAYRTILKLLGCGETETQEPPYNATCAICGLEPTKCYCGQYRPTT